MKAQRWLGAAERVGGFLVSFSTCIFCCILKEALAFGAEEAGRAEHTAQDSSTHAGDQSE